MMSYAATDATKERNMGADRAKRLLPEQLILCAAAILATFSLIINGSADARQGAVAAKSAGASAVETKFRESCAGCHGEGGAGGDRAPPLIESQRLRGLSDAQIKTIIRNGTPGGMPPFPMAEAELDRLAGWIRSKNVSAAAVERPVELIRAGEAFFFGEGDCASCHMVRGRGGTNGPDLSSIAVRSTLAEIERWLDDPTSQTGTRKTAACPGWAYCPDFQWSVVSVRMRDGRTLRGFSRNEGEHDLQLQTLDGRLHMLTERDYQSVARETKSLMPPLRATADQRRALLAYLTSLEGVPLGPLAHRPPPVAKRDMERVTRPEAGEWPSYDGAPSGNRYSTLAQIDRGNVSRLEAKWVFAPGGNGLQTTPLVIDGIMYVTGAQQVCALDARNGRSIWCAPRNSGERPAADAPKGQGAGGRATGPNRGVAVLRDLVYFISDDAYLVALNRLTGAAVWRVLMTDPAHSGRYYNSAAPLIVGDRVVAGVAGGDSPLRGFLAAFEATTGKLAWRLWTIPLPGEPLAETWKGRALPTGGGATWTTGSYDPDAKLLYWAVGNPYPATDGSERGGANLYTNSVIALDPATGRVKWHYQFTPHDLHDWDANAPLVLADAAYKGRNRKLLLQANRNGFFYRLDRLTGEFLGASAFVEKLSWASGVGADGVPILLPGNEPTEAGTLTCPSVRGATNWYGTSYNPGTGLFYVMAAEDCSIYRKVGSIYTGKADPQNYGTRFVRALKIETGELAWEKPLSGSQEANYTGVLSTAGGLVFHGETGGAFAAVDARSGKTLWTFRANDSWRATPMTYMIDGKQYVAVAAGTNILSFALQD
jgi:PQQ-dependent dehydrogenase (methanol/ethanol family)